MWQFFKTNFESRRRRRKEDNDDDDGNKERLQEVERGRGGRRRITFKDGKEGEKKKLGQGLIGRIRSAVTGIFDAPPPSAAAAATVSAAAVALSVGVAVLAANGGGGSGRVQSICNENFIAFDVPTGILVDLPTTEIPIEVPIEVPTEVPITVPIEVPTEVPTNVPIQVPTEVPTNVPIEVPTEVPTKVPIEVPIKAPTEFPIEVPIVVPRSPLRSPSRSPPKCSLKSPSRSPSRPSEFPIKVPIEAPTTIKIPADDIRFAASIRAAEIVRLAKIRAAANRMSDFDGEVITVEAEVHAPPDDNEDVNAMIAWCVLPTHFARNIGSTTTHLCKFKYIKNEPKPEYLLTDKFSKRRVGKKFKKPKFKIVAGV